MVSFCFVLVRVPSWENLFAANIKFVHFRIICVPKRRRERKVSRILSSVNRAGLRVDLKWSLNVDHRLKSRVASILEEAEQAADPKTNGLLDRGEFPIIIRRLLVTIQELLAERDELESQARGSAATILWESAPPECLTDALSLRANDESAALSGYHSA